MADDTQIVTIEDGSGTTEDVEVPNVMLDLLREGEETDAEVFGNLTLMAMAERAHGAVHHSQGDPNPQVAEANDILMDLVEDRFGQTFGELTGHQH